MPHREELGQCQSLPSMGGGSVDVLITVLSVLGIGFGVASMLRRRPTLFRYVFYLSILGATGLRIARSIWRGEGVGAFDTLTAAFLITALLGELIGARRRAKR